MKTTVLILRILFGALMIFASLNFFFNFVPPPPMEGEVAKVMAGLSATVYMFPLIKIIELLVGIAFISGSFIPLANVVIFPVSINILLFHLFLAPEGTLTGMFVVGVNLLLAYYYRANYAGLFQPAKTSSANSEKRDFRVQEEV